MNEFKSILIELQLDLYHNLTYTFQQLLKWLEVFI